MYAYRQVANLPLVVAVGLSTEDLYADWEKRASILAVLLTILGGSYLYFSHSLQREVRERMKAEIEPNEAQAVAERLSLQLSDSLARREALINNTADAMIVARVDATGALLYESVNPVWERLTGVRAHEAINRSPQDILAGPVAEAVLSGWRACVRNRAPVPFVFSLQRSDDAQEHWEALVCPVFSTDGMVQRVIGVARNVTEQKKLQDKLRHAHRMEAVGQLTAGIAHDFNNLLQAMLGALEIATEQTGLDEDGRTSLEIARGAAQRAASLVHQLLAFSGKQRLSPVTLYPEQIIDEIKSIVRSVTDDRFHFMSGIYDNAGPVFVDETQFRECLLNLVLNSRDAAPNGGLLRLRVAAADSADAISAGVPPGEYTRVILEDEGPGIPPETLSQVFEPFFTTKTIGEGPGLGLSMVQGFVRQSGGEVTIESVVGVGTAVTLWLPRAKAAQQCARLVDNPEATGQPSRTRVLVVDDEAPVRQTLSLFLRRAGYDPVVAERAEDALVILQKGEPLNLLVTDQSMPGMTGTELIEEVTRLRPLLPTMLISGYDRVTGIERLHGRVTVLNKPFQGDQFVRQVQALLGAAALRGVLNGETPPNATPGHDHSSLATHNNVYQLRTDIEPSNRKRLSLG